MKTVINIGAKPHNHSVGTSVIVLVPGLPVQVDEKTAEAMLEEWTDIKVLDDKPAEPWEVKMGPAWERAKADPKLGIDLNHKKPLVPAKTEDVPEPPVPIDSEGGKDEGANKFLCSLAGCVEEFTTLKAKQKHMKEAHNI